MGFVDLQRGGDAAFPPGRRHYWKASFLRRLEQGAIDVLVEFAVTYPSPYTQVGLQQMQGQAARAVYVNNLGDDEAERIRFAYGANFDRLVAVKAKYDSDNFFRGNQNVAANSIQVTVGSAAA